ncbi:SLBB domain-containing protein [Massilia sp. TSP1-1-2]|uniref:SLBB domain-containing protein n=1 Tax=Massilia sp. TSP1-1-2 TaxID=2804649 RepID=UPI003CE928DB
MQNPPVPKRVIIRNEADDESDVPAEYNPDGAPAYLQQRQAGTDAERQRELNLARDPQRQNERDVDGRTSVRSASKELRPVPNEFQKFIFDSSGKTLPVFGANFFGSGASTFAPLGNTPVPADYTLGVGDELMIRGSGSIDINYRAKIDRNGLIAIPTVGSVVLAGVKAADAERVIGNAVARLYKGVTVNVNFGKLRAITVYVVGQAKRPGTYTVSSLSTLVTAVFASGGPNANGSMRRVQVKRGGVVAAELDLYSFIARGDKSADVKLRDGDTIFIPAASAYVALVGKVNTPAIYELRGNQDTVESLLDFAGGMPVVADPRRAFLERIDASRSQPRSVEQFVLNGEGLKRTMKNGDVLNITSITPDFSNAVILRGNVDQAVRVPFKPGMRVSDLIPNREYLITRKSIKRQNNALDAGDKEKAKEQRDRDHDTALDTDQDRDRVAENAVSNAKVDSIAARIGGLIDEINWDYAVVERINRSDLTVSLIPFNLGKVFTEPAGPQNVTLQAGDTVTIFSQKDVAVPMERRRIFVRVEGEVNVPGVYQMTAGETLQSLLARAGGPTANGYLFGTAFYREQVRKEQEMNLQKAASRLETQLRNEQSRAAANARSTADAMSMEARRQADLLSAKEAVARLRQLRPEGRIAFGLDPREQSFGKLPPLKLQNGDRLVVPARLDFVHVFGAVNGESSPLWRPNSRVNDYIKLVGMTPDADKDNIFILRVDGSVVSRSSGNWYFGGFGGVEVMPGDSIVIPEKFDKETGWTKFTQGTKEWAQIFANFGLGAAAIKTLRN